LGEGQAPALADARNCLLRHDSRVRHPRLDSHAAGWAEPGFAGKSAVFRWASPGSSPGSAQPTKPIPGSVRD